MFKKTLAPLCVILLMSCSPGTMDLEATESVADSPPEENGLPFNGGSDIGEDNVIDPFGDIFKPTQWI